MGTNGGHSSSELTVWLEAKAGEVLAWALAALMAFGVLPNYVRSKAGHYADRRAPLMNIMQHSRRVFFGMAD